MHYFPDAAALRAWFVEHAATADELQVGYYKRHTGKPSPTWSESVDEALCFGWVDGVRHSVDADRYTIRFTPRRKGSHWSQINVAKVKALIAAKQHDPGRPRRLRGAHRAEDGPRVLRAAPDGVPAGARQGVQGQQGGVGVVLGAAAGVPADRDLVRGERREARDPGEASRNADRGVGRAAAGSSARPGRSTRTKPKA